MANPFQVGDRVKAVWQVANYQGLVGTVVYSTPSRIRVKFDEIEYTVAFWDSVWPLNERFEIIEEINEWEGNLELE